MNRTLRTALALALCAQLASASPQAANPGSPGAPGGAQDVPLKAVTTLRIPGPEQVTMLRMKDGSILWGEITEHTPDGITFARLDSGGLATLDWTFLDPTQEQELRLKFGYVDLDGEELMTDADRVALVDGTEIVGKILERTPTALILKTSFSSSISVPLGRVRATSSEVVPASEIYTRDELYVQELVRTDPESAESQYELGRFCERILDYAHAVEHYASAIALDPGFRSDELPNLLARAEERAALQEQVDFLAEIDSLKRRKNFDEAFDKIAEFPVLYPDSPLQEKLLRLRDQTLKARDRFLVDAIYKRWLYECGRKARAAAVGMTFEEGRTYATESMSDEIAAAVTEHATRWARDLTPDDVRRYWEERKLGRYRTISYGIGTWLLGEDAALKGLETTAAAKPEETLSEAEKQRRALEEKLRVFMENRQQRQRNAANADDAEEKQTWWEQATLGDRQRWVFAYYVEYAKDFDVKEKPLLFNCRECGGQGVKEIIYTGSARSTDGGGRRGGGSQSGSGVGLEECHTCRGIGRTRRIQYR